MRNTNLASHEKSKPMWNSIIIDLISGCEQWRMWDGPRFAWKVKNPCGTKYL